MADSGRSVTCSPPLPISGYGGYLLTLREGEAVSRCAGTPPDAHRAAGGGAQATAAPSPAGAH
ncbi:hypothetical protein GCM10010442_08440 [Kitasatospora kifunensis]